MSGCDRGTPPYPPSSAPNLMTPGSKFCCFQCHNCSWCVPTSKELLGCELPTASPSGKHAFEVEVCEGGKPRKYFNMFNQRSDHMTKKNRPGSRGSWVKGPEEGFAHRISDALQDCLACFNRFIDFMISLRHPEALQYDKFPLLLMRVLHHCQCFSCFSGDFPF